MPKRKKVLITTPFPSLEEVAKAYSLSNKEVVKILKRILDDERKRSRPMKKVLLLLEEDIAKFENKRPTSIKDKK